MANINSNTHYSALDGRAITGFDTFPTEPKSGQYFYDNKNDRLCVYNAIRRQWFFASFTTTTSTSTSTTSTSTSTTSTSTSSSTSSSTTTSSSTSTTTTL